jgi:hypothetical protein
MPHLRPDRAPLAAALVAALAASAAPAAAQTLDDGFVLPRRVVRATVEYGSERWDRYWEGERLRDNGNIGTLTTRSTTLAAGYGVTDRLSVFAALPWVATEASQGVMRGQRGRQDVTVAAKYEALRARVGGRARLSALAMAGVGAPTSDYTPDFLPMSIGLGARRATARAVVHAQDRTGLFVEGAAGHTWRSTVRLDRPAYYTDGRLTLSDEVAMPDVADYTAAVGYQDARWCVPVMLVAQRTLGGGDIRRQDMPFVSNRMDFTRLQGRVMFTPPAARGGLQLHVGAMRTLSGRNVGRAAALSGGATVAFRL